MHSVVDLAKEVKKSSKEINMAKTKIKDQILRNMKKNITENIDIILKENEKDVEKAKKEGLKENLIERLTLNRSRIEDMIRTLDEIIFSKDPIGELVCGYIAKNGLKIEKIRVPIGVIGIIYESRPNVTLDSLALSIKSGNGIILKGGKEAGYTNSIIFNLAVTSIKNVGISPSFIGFIEKYSKEEFLEFIKLRDYIDVIIPRGGKELIEYVVSNATVPVIETGCGNCHIYVDDSCDLDMAINIVINAKISRPTVCNSAESLLVHEDIAEIFLKNLWSKLKKYGVKLYGCKKTLQILKDIEAATEEDYFCEYLDLKMSVKIVSSIKEAIEHISKYSSKHSEAIITSNYFSAEYFLNEVDSAAVYVNASTRFTDGGEFGFGTETGISTQKLHARGPMGLKDLTTTKTIIRGSGQIRL